MHPPLLQPRITLRERIRRPIRPPRAAQPVELGLVRGRVVGAQLVGPLEVLHAQTGRHVPGDVAVEEPGARVVRLEGQQQPALGREHGHVAAHRVGAAQPREVHGRVEDVAQLLRRRGVGRAAQDVEVVALLGGGVSRGQEVGCGRVKGGRGSGGTHVKMHGMREGKGSVGVVLHEPVRPLQTRACQPRTVSAQEEAGHHLPR